MGGPANIDGVLDLLCDFATRRTWTPYQRGWADAQKASTKNGTALPLAIWQASADESDLQLIAAHVVPARKVSFNPLLGTGGNAGKRDFAGGWKRAVDALGAAGAEDPDGAERRRHLSDLLLGEPVTWMIAGLNAASWFSEANKTYNSGARAYRDGVLSPWLMVLACEGLVFFAGGPSRRLGARARSVGAFPFVTRAGAPLTAGEAGKELAEVWAPLWERPMNAAEVVTLFSRGRAEVHGRGVTTPAAFAAAATRRGVDAGITEFHRFTLGRTTSANTFEPRFDGTVTLRANDGAGDASSAKPTTAVATALERVLALVERLPEDRKVGTRWRFVGLRGAIEAAMLRVAAVPHDHEAARALIDATVVALDRVDRNRSLRERAIAWTPLPGAWLHKLFGDEAPSTEARLALSLVSGFRRERPFALYRFGVEQRNGWHFVHVKQAPARWQWRGGPLPAVLSDALVRRTFDWKKDRREADASDAYLPARSTDVEAWLAGAVDDQMIARWLSRLALFDWRHELPLIKGVNAAPSAGHAGTGLLLLYGLLRPLLDLRPVVLPGRPRKSEVFRTSRKARTPDAAHSLANLLRSGSIENAQTLAASRYSMAQLFIVKTEVPWTVREPRRLLASLLFTLSRGERGKLLERWLRPSRW